MNTRGRKGKRGKEQKKANEEGWAGDQVTANIPVQMEKDGTTPKLNKNK